MLTWRRALPFASVFAASGCLMPSPPDLEDPERTRPYIHYLNVDPPLGEPIQVQLSQTHLEIQFLLPFQSEDLGEDISGSLYLFGPDGSSKPVYLRARIPAGEFSTVRNADMKWTPSDERPGCYRLTATLAHASSFGDNGIVLKEREYDAEAVSWLANVYVLEQNDNRLADCPRIGDVN